MYHLNVAYDAVGGEVTFVMLLSDYFETTTSGSTRSSSTFTLSLLRLSAILSAYWKQVKEQ